MNRPRTISMVCLLLALVGCSKSTGYWIGQTKAPDPAQRLHAVHMLQAKSKEATVVVPALMECLKDDNHYVRRDAARALGAFGSDAADAVRPLAERLRDPEPSVRKAAKLAIQEIDPSHVIK